MKKVIVLMAMAAALAGCSKDPAPAATPAPSSAPAPSAAPAPAPAAAPSAAADLPTECQAYLDKVNACIGKQSGAAADAIKQSMDQTKAAWASITDKSALASACKTASDAFAAQASAMKC